MSVDMIGNSGNYMNLPNVSWRFILLLASQHEWMPAGTSRPEHVDLNDTWDGMYDPAMGQGISALDAVGLGAAISRALDANCDDALVGVAKHLTAQYSNAGADSSVSVQVTPRTKDMILKFVGFANMSEGFVIG